MLAGVDEILAQLEACGSEQSRKIYQRHGAREPLYGVKVADLKKILRGHKNDQQLAEKLWETGISDAMYLAGLMADSSAVSPATLRGWMDGAYWYMLAEVAVADLAAESPHGWELGRQWITSPQEMVATGGWGTLSACISILPNDQLVFADIRKDIKHITSTIHNERNRVRYSMNNYIICVGAYIPDLYSTAHTAAAKIGDVTVDMGETSCKTPNALEYIEKIEAKGRVGKKRAHARC